MRSEKGDTTLSTIIGIFVGGILLIVVPLITLADRSDDVAQQAAQSITSDFVETVCNEGRITKESFEEYINELASTGHSYNIEMEVRHLDENIGNKSAWTSSSVVGENEYYSVYTSQIREKLYDGTTSKYLCKEGDQFTATVQNTDKTFSQMLKSGIYGALGKGTYVIWAQKSGTVVSNGK